MTELQNYQDHPVFRYFSMINQIPRCSKKEKAVGDMLEALGREKGFFTERDASGNVRIIKPATKGYESAPRVIVQGHMDMVCVKAPNSAHDFSSMPIAMEEKDGWLTAQETTLGADDAIGVAMGLALLDETQPMPELQILITTDEEEGMSGASGLSSDWLEAEMLLNIDSEEEGFVTSGCAGGSTGKFHLDVEREEDLAEKGWRLQLSGMRGGHSGMNILVEPNNAIKVLAELLRQTMSVASLKLLKFSSGEKHNAIPNVAETTIAFSAEEEEHGLEVLRNKWEEIQARLLKQEPDIHLDLEEVSTDERPLTLESANNFINLLDIMPHGVYRMRPDNINVLASDNLAVVRLEEKTVELFLSTRSSSMEVLKELQAEILRAARTFGGDGTFGDGYPAWEFEEQSHLRDLFQEVYRAANGEDAQVLDIHAGLECALFSRKNPDLDMISIGPDVEGAHTIKERLNIASTLRTYDYVKKLMSLLATQSGIIV